MSKSVSIEQSHNVISVLINNVDWSEQDGKVLQEIIRNPCKAGEQFTIFLKNGANLEESNTIKVDRSKPFEPTKFIGRRWTIVEQDKRSLSLTQVDLTKIRFETCLESSETFIKGEEKLKRLKKMNCIRLDAKIFQTLWENKHLIPETWKEKISGGIRFNFFNGTVLRSPDGYRCILCLSWYTGKWHWSDRCLVDNWSVINPSAVLKSS